MKILLVQPSVHNGLKPTRLPASLMALASFLGNKKVMMEFIEKKGFPVDETILNEIDITIIDEQAEGYDYLENILQNDEYKIIGFTAVTSLTPKAAKLAQLVKDNFSNTITILGGMHVTIEPVKTLIKFLSFDMVVVGEGEETFAEIVIRSLSNRDINNVDGSISRLSIDKIFSPRKKVIERYKHPLIAESLKYLKLDKYHEFDVPSGEHIGRHSILRTSIGCPYKCSFCCSSMASSGMITDVITAKQIFDEIIFCNINYKISSFYVVDDIFTYSKKRILELRDLIVNNNLKIKLMIMTRADLLDEDIVVALKQIGVIRCSIGVETGDQDLLDQVISKKLYLENIENATAMIRNSKIHLHYYLMVGLPTQDWNSIIKTIKFILINNPDSIATSIAIPYPGTSLFNDKRINVLDIEDLDKYFHEPAPQVKNHRFPGATTFTDVMDSIDIGLARYIIMSSFNNREKFISK